MLSHARSLALLAALAVGSAWVGVPSAAAQPYGPYVATPPTAGALYRDGQTGRYLLGGTWLMRMDPAGTGVAAGLWRDQASTAGWTQVPVPNSDNAGDHSNAGMDGYTAWYRRDFMLPREPSGTSWIVRFESVNYGAQVWLNGRRIGSHAGAFEPFEFDLGKLVRSGVNRLVVRVDGRRTQAAIPPGTYQNSPYVGGWWNYGGILREVYLRAVRQVDIQQFMVRPLLRCPTCPALISEQAVLHNVSAKSVTVRLRGSFGGATVDFGTASIPAGGTWTPTASVRLSHPDLWAPGNPYLYRATLTLTSVGKHAARLGGYLDYTGVRLIRVAGGRIELNGRLLNLRGVGIQEQTLGAGNALAPADYRQLMGWVLALHATLIRSQYPLDQQLLEMADRAGVLVWLEVPVYQVPSGYLTDPTWRALADEMLTNAVLIDRNHPSVLLWSVGNELQTPAPGGEASYIAHATTLVKTLDPTRPVGMAVSTWPGVPCQTAYAPLDVIGVNEYFGWYDAGIGATADRDALGPFVDSLRACYPSQALMVTEFGFEANRDGPVEERGTYEFQNDAISYHLGVFAARPYLSGVVYWALQDFVCRPGWGGGNPWPQPPFFYKGLVGFQGTLKPAFATVAASFAATPQIAPG